MLGAMGGFGGAIAFELLNAERPVRLLVRDPKQAIARFGPFSKADYVKADVQDAAMLEEAAAGCALIVHAINYPYSEWDPAMRTATANVIAAARRHACTILFPGNVYALGPPPTWKAPRKARPSNPPLTEAAPNRPTTKKGRFRAELEKMLEDATKDGRARVIVLRAGDYFGPTIRNGLVDRIFGAAARGRAPACVGRFDRPHQWAYLPDLAFAAVRLLGAAPRLRPFQVVHFAGYTAPTQREFLEKAAEAGGKGARPRRISWAMMRLAAMLDADAREMLELRYLFDEAVLLDDSLLRRLISGFTPTPIEEAITATVQSYRAEAHAALPGAR